MGAAKHIPEKPLCPICSADMDENEDGELECVGDCDPRMYLEEIEHKPE